MFLIRLRPSPLDVTDARSIERGRQVVAEQVGRRGLAGLVNNAGIAVVGVAVSRVWELIAYGKWCLAEMGRVFCILHRRSTLPRPQQALVLDEIHRMALTPGARERSGQMLRLTGRWSCRESPVMAQSLRRRPFLDE